MIKIYCKNKRFLYFLFKYPITNSCFYLYLYKLGHVRYSGDNSENMNDVILSNIRKYELYISIF